MFTHAAGRRGLIALALLSSGLLVAPSPAAPQPAVAAALPDVQKLGPQIGERVPDFTLADQRGRQRTLASLFGPKGLMLVFFRSADW